MARLAIEVMRVKAVDAGARLVLVTIPPQADNPLETPKRYQAPRTEHLNTLLAEFAAAHPNDVNLVDMAEIVCPGGAPCPTVVDGIVLRPKDGGHYEAEGAAWVAPRFVDQLFTALRAIDARAGRGRNAVDHDHRRPLTTEADEGGTRRPGRTLHCASRSVRARSSRPRAPRGTPPRRSPPTRRGRRRGCSRPRASR